MIIPSYVGTYSKDKYLERRKNTLDCMTENVAETQEFVLSQHYFCTIDMVQTKKSGVCYTIINLFDKDRKNIVRLERNSLEAWVCLIDDHPSNKKDYFLAGEDHQGYSVFNLIISS